MSLPRRLADDPSAAPWLAEQLRALPAGTRTQALSPNVRALVGEALATRLQASARAHALAWSLAAAACAAALVLIANSRYSGQARVEREVSSAKASRTVAPPSALAPIPSFREPSPGLQVHESRTGQTAVPAARASTSARARVRDARQHERKQAQTRRVAERPAWLVEARAALAQDPQRTLALIQANRVAGQPVSPEVVELTIEALEAQRTRLERANAQP